MKLESVNDQFRNNRSWPGGGVIGTWFILLMTSGLAGGAEIAPRSSAIAARAGDWPVYGQFVVPLPTEAETNRQAELRQKICAFAGAASEVGTFLDPAGSKAVLRYRLFKPLHFDSATSYPLVVSLHGGGAAGKFESLLTCATPVFAFGPARFASAEEQQRYPAFVLVPWSGGTSWGDRNLGLLVGLIRSLVQDYRIDTKRLYVTGQSMGGYGTWRIIAQYPELFAAAIPIAGGGDPASVHSAKDVKVWAFHGSKDGIVPVSETRSMVSALAAAGGKVIYWEYEGGTHAGTAERGYCEVELVNWLFAQSK